METIKNSLKEWDIKKRELKEMGIDPDKNICYLTLKEMGFIADFLDISVEELVGSL